MDDRYVIMSWLEQNGKIISNRDTLSLSEWKREKENHPLWNKYKDNMGIGGNALGYYEFGKGQNPLEEMEKINIFLEEYLNHYAKSHNFKREELSLRFINYGKTQLVYVLTEPTGKKYTLLVKQPAVKFGDVKREAENLIELHSRDTHVVSPTEYFANNDQELYLTPYLTQARCIASCEDENWGVYVPEPIYRFEDFNKTEADIVNSAMIAKLISLFDTQKNEGLSQCKLGGGDFVLLKGWEDRTPTTEWILENLYLIAARDKIHCSIEEYINIIRNEFSRITIKDHPSTLKLNIRGRLPMTVYQIEKGIALGKSMLKAKEKLTSQAEDVTM